MANIRVYLNTFAQIGGKISTALLSIVMVKILTSYLSVGDYGLYSKIYNFMGFFSVIADMGIYTITIREISAHKHDDMKVREIVGNMLTIRTIMGLVCIIASMAIAYFLPGYNSQMALISIFVTGIFVLFGLWNSAILSVLQAYLKTEFSLVSTTLGKITNVAGVAAIAYLFFPKELLGAHPELWYNAFIWFMVAGLLGNIVMTGSLFIYAKKFISFRFLWQPKVLKTLFLTSFSYGIALFLNVVYFKVDVLLLSFLEAPKQADISIALYSVPMKIVEVGMLFGTLFLNSMLPLFTSAIKEKQEEKLRGMVGMSFEILYALGLGIVCFLLLNGGQILSILSTKDYISNNLGSYTSLDSLRISVFVFLFYFLSSLFTYILIANNAQGKLLYINGILTVVNIVGNLLVIPHFSFVGSSTITLLCQILLLIMTYRATRDLVHFRLPYKVIALFLFCGGVFIAINYGINQFFHLAGYAELLISLVLFGIFYGLPLLFFLYKKHQKSLAAVS